MSTEGSTPSPPGVGRSSPVARVAVFFGGQSGEHEVSCTSAVTTVAALRSRGHAVVAVGIDRVGGFHLADPEGDPLVASGPPVQLPVPADLAQLMFPLTLTVSVFLFLRGHNAPGGGFIAGLVLAVPLLIQYVIQGAASVESRFGFDYIRCIGVGLVVAATSGAASLLFDVEFLTSGHADLEIPLLGTLELASAMGFDTGVYLVVFGGAMLILSMLGTIKPSRTRVARLGVIEPGDRSVRTGENG